VSAVSERSRSEDPLICLTAIGLGAGRLAIGAALWLAPRACTRALGFTALDRRGLALARIAATRDVVLGIWQLRSLSDPAELRRASTAVAVADAGDAVTFALLLGDGERSAGVRGLAAALPAAVAGAWISRREAQGFKSKRLRFLDM
jgi:hypothetical protein